MNDSMPLAKPNGPQLTMAALQRLHRLMDAVARAHGRLRIRAGDSAGARLCGLVVDSTVGADDVELGYVRVPVVLDAETHRRLSGCRIDYRAAEPGDHLIVQPIGCRLPLCAPDPGRPGFEGS